MKDNINLKVDKTVAVRKKTGVVNRVGRPSKMVFEMRVKEIAAMILCCKPRSEIIDKCVKEFGVRETSALNIITAAYKYIKETHTIDKEGLVSTHLELYYEIYNQAKTLGDARGAIQALNSIEKLLKLTIDVAIQNNSISLNLKDMTLNELKELLKPKD